MPYWTILVLRFMHSNIVQFGAYTAAHFAYLVLCTSAQVSKNGTNDASNTYGHAFSTTPCETSLSGEILGNSTQKCT